MQGKKKSCPEGSRFQKTLKKKVSFSGLGLHSGREATLQFCPAEEGFGIVFRRMDLPNRPLIPARLDFVSETSYCTGLSKDGVKINTVEHILAALYGCQIDNLLIELSSMEPPVANGSSSQFVDLIKKAGVVEQKAFKSMATLEKPVYWSNKETHLVALPFQGCQISYVLHYPNSKALQNQYYSLLLNEGNFVREISSCRTFCQYEDLDFLLEQGLIQGGSLSSAVVVKDEVILSDGGLFFPDEMVRHKILDLIGDFSLIGMELRAQIVAVRSGHSSNVAFAKKLYQEFTKEKAR